MVTEKLTLAAVKAAKPGDALKDHVNSRVETLRTDMHEAIGRLGDRMQRGFDDLRKELTEVLKAINKRKGD